MSEKKKPPFRKVCRIRTKDGAEYEATYIRLNHYAGKIERWRREGDVPRKQRYIKPAEVVGWEEEGTAECITVNNANGYSGTLHKVFFVRFPLRTIFVGWEMTIYYHDEEVLHTTDATATNEAELNEVLETMPQFMDMLNEQVKNAISKGARK